MVRFLLDENFPRPSRALLEARGHDVATTGSLHLRGRQDYTILATAADEGRIVISFNVRDFMLLHCAWIAWSARWKVREFHAGILGMAQFTVDWDEYARLIHEHTRSQSIAGALHLFRPSTGWFIWQCR